MTPVSYITQTDAPRPAKRCGASVFAVVRGGDLNIFNNRGVIAEDFAYICAIIDLNTNL